ncbi:hypothetical protein TIFTF001_022403 [Ficus carica]|uniref:Uncharacterized protein n=1 Tax=Ficus carica TaxID=3494 RepID=A0AA88DJZ6_FICCA|nr:hypothetical protein TIFTF001_022403 [Ficus carica]
MKLTGHFHIDRLVIIIVTGMKLTGHNHIDRLVIIIVTSMKLTGLVIIIVTSMKLTGHFHIDHLVIIIVTELDHNGISVYTGTGMKLTGHFHIDRLVIIIVTGMKLTGHFHIDRLVILIVTSMKLTGHFHIDYLVIIIVTGMKLTGHFHIDRLVIIIVTGMKLTGHNHIDRLVIIIVTGMKLTGHFHIDRLVIIIVTSMKLTGAFHIDHLVIIIVTGMKLTGHFHVDRLVIIIVTGMKLTGHFHIDRLVIIIVTGKWRTFVFSSSIMVNRTAHRVMGPTKTIVMRYGVEPGLPLVRIQCDADVKFYIQLKKKDVHVLSKFPITIDVLDESAAETMPPELGESNHIDVQLPTEAVQSDEAIQHVDDRNWTFPPSPPPHIPHLPPHVDESKFAGDAHQSNENSIASSIGTHSIANYTTSQSVNVPSSDSLSGSLVVADYTPVTIRINSRSYKVVASIFQRAEVCNHDNQHCGVIEQCGSESQVNASWILSGMVKGTTTKMVFARREEAIKLTSKLASKAEKLICTNFSVGLLVTSILLAAQMAGMFLKKSGHKLSILPKQSVGPEGHGLEGFCLKEKNMSLFGVVDVMVMDTTDKPVPIQYP